MHGIGLNEILVLAVVGCLYLVPMWMILAKAGFPGSLSLLLLIPVLNLFVLYYVAFVPWRARERSARAPSPYDPIHPS